MQAWEACHNEGKKGKGKNRGKKGQGKPPGLDMLAIWPNPCYGAEDDSDWDVQAVSVAPAVSPDEAATAASSNVGDSILLTKGQGNKLKEMPETESEEPEAKEPEAAVAPEPEATA